MKVSDTPIEGLKLIEPTVYFDNRGSFFESYNRQRYIAADMAADFIQDNESFSVRGVIRGLHYQLSPYDQAKLVRVVSGRVFDVAVDLRVGSPSFGKWYGAELSGENRLQMFIPRGFAHGFAVMSEYAVFAYKCDNLYHYPAERSIRFNDPFLNIDWHIEEETQIVSEKDYTAPLFKDAEINFKF